MHVPQYLQQTGPAGLDPRFPGGSGRRIDARQTTAVPGGPVAGTVIGSLEPHGVEVCRNALDLAPEVRGVEPALAERLGRCVRSGQYHGAAPEQRLQEGLDDQGVARVVQLELVEAQQPDPGVVLAGTDHAPHANEMHQFLKRDVGTFDGAGGVEGSSEKVSLAGAETAIEIQAPAGCPGAAPPGERTPR